MWSEFIFAALLLSFFIYIPGFFVLYRFTPHWTAAFALAPLFSILGYAFLAILYAKFSINCSWALLFFPLVLLGTFLSLLTPNRFTEKSGLQERRNYTRSFILYITTGVVVCALLFIAPLTSPESFICGNDVALHLRVPRSFIETGNWSILEVTGNPYGSVGFYPSTNSLLAAMTISCTNVPVPLAVNVTNAVIIALIYPLCVWVFLTSIFDDVRYVYIGAALWFVFFGFPWEFLVRSVLLYANLLGYAILPGMLALFMQCFKQKLSRQERTIQIILTALAGAAVSIAHPNAIFSSLLFIVVYVSHYLFTTDYSPISKHRMAFLVGWIAIFVFCWILAASLPFLQNVVTNPYDAKWGLRGTIVRLLSLYSPHIGAQYIPSILILIGAIACILNKAKRWIVFPCLIAAALFVAASALPDGSAKHLLTGFWYNHNTRLFAAMSIYAVPIAVYAFMPLFDLLERRELKTNEKQFGKLKVIAPIGILSLFLAVLVFPTIPLPRAVSFLSYTSSMQDFNDPNGSKSFLTEEERVFLEKVNTVVQANDGYILNMPHDGSGLAYGPYGTNTIFRSFYSPGKGDMELLTGGINEIARRDDIIRITKDYQIEYVLQLDPPSEQNQTIYSNRYKDSDWAGIQSVTDTTPGFELVLSEGDMRLYRIICPEAA